MYLMLNAYESTSHYDPETKQSRPVRKYLGREDPVTGELIPSSQKRGRKKDIPDDIGAASGISKDDTVSVLRSRYEKELSARDTIIRDQAAMIRKLEAQKASLVEKLSCLLQELSK